jgi:hypothetical protein
VVERGESKLWSGQRERQQVSSTQRRTEMSLSPVGRFEVVGAQSCFVAARLGEFLNALRSVMPSDSFDASKIK